MSICGLLQIFHIHGCIYFNFSNEYFFRDRKMLHEALTTVKFIVLQSF